MGLEIGQSLGLHVSVQVVSILLIGKALGAEISSEGPEQSLGEHPCMGVGHGGSSDAKAARHESGESTESGFSKASLSGVVNSVRRWGAEGVERRMRAEKKSSHFLWRSSATLQSTVN